MGLEYAKSSNMRDFGAGWCLPCPLSARKGMGHVARCSRFNFCEFIAVMNTGSGQNDFHGCQRF